MRLIQPTLLFLGMAIHWATASPPADVSSRASNVNPRFDQLTNCIIGNCYKKFILCTGVANCKQKLFCLFGCGNDIRKCIQCGIHNHAEDVLQCAADNKCFNLPNTCPGENAIDKKNPDNPNLVEQLAKNAWWAVVSLAPKNNAFLNYPCLEVKYEGTGKNASIKVKFCIGDTASGQCSTRTVKEFGQGKQEGESGIIEFQMSGIGVVKPKTLTVHVHELSEDGYVLVSVCQHNPYMQDWSALTLFSKYRTWKDLLANSKDPKKTEKAIKDAIAKQGGDYTKVHEINAATCNI